MEQSRSICGLGHEIDQRKIAPTEPCMKPKTNSEFVYIKKIEDKVAAQRAKVTEQ